MKPLRAISMYRRSDNGAQWIKNIAAPKPSRPKTRISINEVLKPFLTGESKGDVVLAILLAVRNLLRTAGSWCRANRALGPGGLEIETTSSHAERWSMFGALDAVTSAGLESLKVDIIKRWKCHLPTDEKASLGRWEADDSRKHVEVIRVLNLAIGARKSELAEEK